MTNEPLLTPEENESAKKLKAWAIWLAEYCDDWIDHNYDGASDAARCPVTCEEFVECFKEHLNNHVELSVHHSYWTDEFCPFCGLEGVTDDATM